ncbi:MAG TPA: 30S ribosomal protein S21 [Ktedonobacteraceae bacterium]|nr:30S ribosomal protein S21 [Ktedonobacteraceae bacterium]
MSEVKVSEHEAFETALKRFNRKIQQAGILAEARRRAHFEKPGVARKRKADARRRKAARKA